MTTTGASFAGAPEVPDRTTHPPRARATRGTTPLVLGLFVVVLVSAGFSLGVYRANLHNGLLAVSFTAVGAVVLTKRPGHREGWLFIATGLAHAVMFFGRQYGLSAADGAGARPAAEWVTWLGVWPLPLVLALTGVTLMCFPDGRLPSPRWRVVVAAMVAPGMLLALVSALWPVEYADNDIALAHPLDVAGLDTAQPLWNVAGAACYLLFQVAWVACVIVRLRHAHGDEARQLRWFAYAVAAAAVVMVVGFVAFGSPALGLLVVPIVPLAAGMAIVKYRLYDIDPVINKTIVVGAMAGIITAGYVAVVVGIGGLLGVSAGPHPVLSLVATAIVAVVFEPARRRVQRWADRLVFGERPSPYEALARLSAQLNHRIHTPDLYAGLASTVADGVGATAVTLWVAAGDELVAAASWPPQTGGGAAPVTSPCAVDALADERAQVRQIVHQGSRRGAITFTKPPGEALTASEERLLNDLVAQAGLVIDNVGLGVELQHRLHQISLQATELQAAGKRIVAAQDEARRRIERDLHDGAQQQLVTLALSLQAISQHAASNGDDHLTAEIDHARQQLSQALAALREMARGIHPAILTEEGLEPAVGFLAERAPLPVHVEICLDRRPTREVEAAAYFVVSEAITNAVKHGDASSITIRGRLGDGRLRFEVIDNGRGGADGHWGSGLQGLFDRLATLDGRLTVDSPAGGGTRLVAEIPCA